MGTVSDEVSLVADDSAGASSSMTGGGGTGAEPGTGTGGSRVTELGAGDILWGGGIAMYDLSSATGIQLSGG